jgi:hypothetical protein
MKFVSFKYLHFVYSIEVKQEIMKYEKSFPTSRRIYDEISQKHSTMENHSISFLKVRHADTCFMEITFT